MYIYIDSIYSTAIILFGKDRERCFFCTVTDPASCRVITQSRRADAGRQRQQRQPAWALKNLGSLGGFFTWRFCDRSPCWLIVG